MSKTVTPEEEAKALELARQFVAGDYDGPDFYSDADHVAWALLAMAEDTSKYYD